MTDRAEERVVVCGGGLSGLTAALTALEMGIPVTLCEKAPELGGTTALSGGGIWAYKEFERIRADIPDGDGALQWLVYDNIDAARTWLAGQGVTLAPNEEPPELRRRERRMDPPQAIAALAAKFALMGGELRLETALDSLVTKNGAIDGVRLACGDRIEDEPTRAVVLATGGFQGNPELLCRYVIRDPDNLYLRANAWSTGDAFLAATQIGAAASPGLDTFYGHALALPPATFSKLQLRDLSQYYGQHACAINLRGERFVDESEGTSEQMLNQRLALQPQGRGFYVIDDEIMGFPAIKGLKLLTKVVVERARAAKANVVVAETIADLCRKLVPFGLPEQRVLREINEFNRLIECGAADDLTPPRRHNRKSLRKAPFYAVAVKASITFAMGGLQIDEHARVLRRSGGSASAAPVPATRAYAATNAATLAIGTDYRQTAIGGLYAAGCDAGNISHGEYFGSLAPALVTGRTAGHSAAAFIKALKSGAF